MRGHLVRSVVFCTVALLILATATGAELGCDQARALNAASAFADAAGIPFGEDLEAVAQPPDGRYGERWLVKYHDFADVTVDAQTGSVVAANNRAAVAEFLAQPTQVKVTEQEALAKASPIAAAMGVTPQNARLLDVKLQEFTDGQLYQWHVRWVRTANGIPYDYDMAIVMLDPTTGAVLGTGKAFWSDPPPSTQVKLNRDEAVALALQSAAQLGMETTAGGELQAEPKVVQPNNYWSADGPIEAKYPQPSRVAWVVIVPTRAVPESELVAHKVFWIDAADGKLLGGTRSKGPVSMPAPASASLGIAKTTDNAAGIPAMRELARMGPAILVGFGLIVTGWVLIRRRPKAT